MRQFLDGKHNSKLAATVNINLRHSFKVFFKVNDTGVAVFSMVNVKQCFEIGRVTHNKKIGMDYFKKRCCTVYINLCIGYNCKL